jgi:hypothetical protein
MIGKQIDDLSRAIASYEGWDADGQRANGLFAGSRSYRNHNPGNLRSSPFQAGSDGAFAFFYSDFVGLFALQYDLWIKASGKSTTGLTPDSTLAQFIHTYAPPTENDSDAYLQFIVLKTGFSPEMKLRELLAS